MHGFTPDQVGAFVGGVIVMLGALVGVIAKAWQALSEIRGEVKPDHGGSMKDASDETRTTVSAIADDLHALDVGIGGIRDDLRLIRRDQAQTREEVAQVRASTVDLDDRLDVIEKDKPAVGGWDYGENETKGKKD